MMMKKFVLLLLGLLLLSGVVSAYQISIEAPATLSVGRPLVINGTTNFGIGTPIDVVLYYQLTTNTEVKRKIAYVQSDHSFRVIFDTTTLKKGTYKVEVPASGLGDSVNTRIVQLIDRTDEIKMTTSSEDFTGTLTIAGTLQDNKNAGVQVEITGPDGERIFGPQYIATNNQGAFKFDTPITRGGEYEVSFTDNSGFIGTKTISVVQTVTTTQATAPATGTARLSAHAQSSRDSPAYFEVKAGQGTMNIYTSSQIDWVMEYVDGNGNLRSVNSHGELNPERIAIEGNGKTLYFKVYPFRYSDNGEVFLYAENAQSVKASPTVPSVFGPPGSDAAGPEATQSPFYPACACLAILCALLFRRRFF